MTIPEQHEPFLPKDGSEDYHKLLVPLLNTNDNPENKGDDNNAQNIHFIGRERLIKNSLKPLKQVEEVI